MTKSIPVVVVPPPGGYAWWYFDALSDDGEHALTAIFFVGSVFSPTYAARVRRGEVARAEDHLGVNLALYHRGRQVAWVMSEYGRGALGGIDDAGPHIADSRVVALADGGLRVEIRERSAPFLAALTGWGRPLECTIELSPASTPTAPVELGVVGGAHHNWRVIMPRARVHVTGARPEEAWQGDGYHDANWGEGRLEAAFCGWSWARFHDGPHDIVLYRIVARSGLARAFLRDSRVDAKIHEVATLPEGETLSSRWGLRMPRSFVAGDVVCRTGALLEQAPFYARYRAHAEVRGQALVGIGEHLDLDRFGHPFVQFLLRFKTRVASPVSR